ncbi:MAG TPA: hypothetical protein DCS63_01465 [Elusimicrobia bacterium]|nr:hypothetical protein [Elusimicrobiota bacterium]
MIFAYFLALALWLHAPAAAQTGLNCPELKPRARAVTISRMQPLRRGGKWLEGSPKNSASTSCDPRGMKTGEAEYDGKKLLLRHSYVYTEKEEARAVCAGLKTGERPDTTFSDEDRSPADEFCRRALKKDFGVVLVHDASPGAGPENARKPVRQIFRLYGHRGLVAEERSFDQLMNLESVTLYAYDKAGDLTGRTVSDFDGRQLGREAFTRSKAANSREHAVYGENDQLLKKTVYELREDGSLRREVRSVYDPAGQEASRSEIYCDEKGRPLKELAYDADAAEPKYEYTYAYKYDAKGNWTEERKTRMMIYNGKRLADTQYAPEISRRELSYY